MHDRTKRRVIAGRIVVRATIHCLCLLALCVGCSSRPTIGRLSSASTVVAFGDSLTFGTGADKADNYPALLSGMIGCPVINAGRPGEETAEGLSRLPGVLKKHEPDLVILCHAGNDMLNGQLQQHIARNLNAMIALIRSAHSDVILISVPKPGLAARPPMFYSEIADEHRIPFAPDTLSTIMSTPALKSDYVHLNAAGYLALAQSIAALIRVSSES